MVRIVGGNIVNDDEPAAKQASAPNAHTPAAAGAGGSSVFDWSAAPISIANTPPEECVVGGFAGVDIYGARFAAKHLIALAAVSAFFGLRGFIVGSVAWAVYKYNQNAAQRPASGQSARSRPAARAGDIPTGQLFGAPPAGRREYVPGSGLPSGSQQTGNSASATNSWSARGRGQKLGS